MSLSEHPEDKIPSGPYCYDKNGVCPYWGKDNAKPTRENGFCTYLDTRDWDDKPGIPLL